MLQSESGKLFTWGSTDDMGQSYVAAGKHEVLVLSVVLQLIPLQFQSINFTNVYLCILQEVPEAFPLPSEVAIVKAAAGWAHCVAVTGMILIL